MKDREEQRVISPKEEQAYRLVSHNFEGLSLKEAAARMKITVGRVRDLLSNVKRKAPQLFPILNSVEVAVLKLIENGAKPRDIVHTLGMSKSTLDGIMRRLRDAGELVDTKYGDRVNHRVSLDAADVEGVRQKF